MRTKTEIFQIFENDCIKPGFEHCMKKLEHTFQESKDAFAEYFAEILEKACCTQKEAGQEFPWAYLSIEMLRTRLRQRDYRCRLMAYGERWYLGKGRNVGELDASVILKQYHELELCLKEQAKRYAGRISESQIEEHMERLLPVFHEYVKEMVWYAVCNATDQTAFRHIEKTEEFQIRVGECLEPGYLVYMERQEKDRDKILKWLEKNEREAYCYQDFRGMDFGRMDLSDHDFRYTDFREAVLEDADVSLSLLAGARFWKGRLKGCRMIGSMLHGADFTKADLRDAQMDYSLMYDGKDAGMGWRIAGFPEGKFCGADLRGASFKNCIYCGVDFRSADVRGADFRGARLYRCLFTKEQEEFIKTIV